MRFRVTLSLLIGAMEMVIRVLCFLIQGNMDAALVTFGQPIRLTKVPINQKPQNCRFVLTDESGQKMRGKNTRGLILPHNSLCGNRQDNLFKKCVVFSINVSRCFARSVASEKMIGTWRFLISDTPPPLHNANMHAMGLSSPLYLALIKTPCLIG